MKKDKIEKIYWYALGGYAFLVLMFFLFGFILKPVDVEHSWEQHTLYLALHPFTILDFLGTVLCLAGAGGLLGVPKFFGYEYYGTGKVLKPVAFSIGAILLGAILISI